MPSSTALLVESLRVMTRQLRASDVRGWGEPPGCFPRVGQRVEEPLFHGNKTWVEDLFLPVIAGGFWAIYLALLSLSFF